MVKIINNTHFDVQNADNRISKLLDFKFFLVGRGVHPAPPPWEKGPYTYTPFWVYTGRGRYSRVHSRFFISSICDKIRKPASSLPVTNS